MYNTQVYQFRRKQNSAGKQSCTSHPFVDHPPLYFVVFFFPLFFFFVCSLFAACYCRENGWQTSTQSKFGNQSKIRSGKTTKFVQTEPFEEQKSRFHQKTNEEVLKIGKENEGWQNPLVWSSFPQCFRAQQSQKDLILLAHASHLQRSRAVLRTKIGHCSKRSELMQLDANSAAQHRTSSKGMVRNGIF